MPMHEVHVPALDLRPIELEPRVVRGGAADAPPGRLQLGGPFWTRLGPDTGGDHPETKGFLADPAWRWALGVLAFTVEPGDDGDRYERAWVDLELIRIDGELPDAVVWSIRPERITHIATKSTTVSVGPSLQIGDVGVEAAVERGVERPMHDVALDPQGEMTTLARWLLRRTPSAELAGCTRLAVVVRAPRGSLVEARLTVGAVTARRKALFFWPRTEHLRPFQVSTVP